MSNRFVKSALREVSRETLIRLQVSLDLVVFFLFYFGKVSLSLLVYFDTQDPGETLSIGENRKDENENWKKRKVANQDCRKEPRERKRGGMIALTEKS